MSARRTVAAVTKRFAGVGLHSGAESWIEVHPSRFPGEGIIFRNDRNGAEVTASLNNVVSTNRSTCLGTDSVRIDTVEHLLSALYGLGISDAVVHFEGVELPIGDGSALPFVDLLDAAGTRTFDSPLEELTIERVLAVTDGKGAVMTAVPSDRLWVSAVVDYSTYPAIGVQAATFAGGEYKAEVASARTYGFHHELTALRAAGLGLGASLDNVVALGDLGEADSRTPLRMPDELVRHKILDIIGDLSLLQARIKIGIVAYRPSHTLNVCLSKMLAAAATGQE